MAQLIEKQYVGDYNGETVYLETNYSGGNNGLVSIIAFSYKPGMGGSEALYMVELIGFNGRAEYYMEDYGETWRLWDVFIETPSIQQRNRIPWVAEW